MDDQQQKLARERIGLDVRFALYCSVPTRPAGTGETILGVVLLTTLAAASNSTLSK